MVLLTDSEGMHVLLVVIVSDNTKVVLQLNLSTKKEKPVVR